MPSARMLAAMMPCAVSSRSSTSPGMPRTVKKTTGMYMHTYDGPPGGGPTWRAWGKGAGREVGAGSEGAGGHGQGRQCVVWLAGEHGG